MVNILEICNKTMFNVLNELTLLLHIPCTCSQNSLKDDCKKNFNFTRILNCLSLNHWKTHTNLIHPSSLLFLLLLFYFWFCNSQCMVFFYFFCADSLLHHSVCLLSSYIGLTNNNFLNSDFCAFGIHLENRIF